jgi:hypothetical protein
MTRLPFIIARGGQRLDEAILGEVDRVRHSRRSKVPFEPAVHGLGAKERVGQLGPRPASSGAISPPCREPQLTGLGMGYLGVLLIAQSPVDQ